MNAPNNPLEHDHTSESIAARLESNFEHSILGDFVLGAVDGTITTFAIVSGVAGAGLSTSVALVLGLANVLADGFSMAVGNYLKARSDSQIIERYRRIEEKHIQQVPSGEREEVRQIFTAKGFSGDLLEQIVDVITADRKRWVDTMLTEEWGLQLHAPSPRKAALVTFTAFVLAGLIPLAPLPFSVFLGPQSTFVISVVTTSLTFLGIGAIRGRALQESMVSSAVETLLVGGIAAALAYAVGGILRGYVGA